MAQLLGAQPAEVVFTASATESNALALHAALAVPGAPRRLVVSAIEHAGLLQAARAWAAFFFMRYARKLRTLPENGAILA